MTTVPKGWNTCRLDEVVELIRGVTYSSKDVLPSRTSDSIPLLRATNIHDGNLDYEEPVYLPLSAVKQKQILQVGDSVIASSSGSIQVVGKSARVTEATLATFGAFCTALRPKQIDPRFLAYFLQDSSLRQKWSDLARGSNINNLKSTDIASTLISFPSPDEQEAIVSSLDSHFYRLNKSTADLNRAQQLAEALGKSLLNRAFAGHLVNRGTND